MTKKGRQMLIKILEYFPSILLKSMGKFIGLTHPLHSNSYSPKLLSTKSLPTALNDHRHRSNHLLMSPKTHLLWLHNFPWMKCCSLNLANMLESGVS